MSQTILEYIDKLENQSFKFWTSEQIAGYATALMSIKQFILEQKQTTFTIEEVGNWLNKFHQADLIWQAQHNLSAENIIKANGYNHGDDDLTEEEIKKEEDNLYDEDERQYDEEHKPSIEIIMKPIPEIDNPQSFSITKEDLDKSNKIYPDEKTGYYD